MKIANKGIENLKPFETLTEEQQRKIRSKGGKRSAEIKKERKKLKEELLLLLSEGDNNRRMSIAIFERALNGDTKAFEVIRDTIGEKPKEEIEVKDVTPKWFKE